MVPLTGSLRPRSYRQVESCGPAAQYIHVEVLLPVGIPGSTMVLLVKQRCLPFRAGCHRCIHQLFPESHSYSTNGTILVGGPGHIIPIHIHNA